MKLTRDDHSPSQEILSGDNGQFAFSNIAPGAFQLSITSAGLATQTSSGILHAGEVFIVPQIVLAIRFFFFFCIFIYWFDYVFVLPTVFPLFRFGYLANKFVVLRQDHTR